MHNHKDLEEEEKNNALVCRRETTNANLLQLCVCFLEFYNGK